MGGNHLPLLDERPRRNSTAQARGRRPRRDRSDDGIHLVWHDGGADGSGFRAAIMIDPADHVAVTLTCNTDTFRAIPALDRGARGVLGRPSSITPADMVR
jgi:hypothetical protein